MELSILQFAKDNNPRAVSIGAVVDMIRAGSWPPGYPPILLVQGVFEKADATEDIVSMSGLAVASFKVWTLTACRPCGSRHATTPTRC